MNPALQLSLTDVLGHPRKLAQRAHQPGAQSPRCGHEHEHDHDDRDQEGGPVLRLVADLHESRDAARSFDVGAEGTLAARLAECCEGAALGIGEPNVEPEIVDSCEMASASRLSGCSHASPNWRAMIMRARVRTHRGHRASPSETTRSQTTAVVMAMEMQEPEEDPALKPASIVEAKHYRVRIIPAQRGLTIHPSRERSRRRGWS